MYYDSQTFLSLQSEEKQKISKVYSALGYFFAILSIINFVTPALTGQVIFFIVGVLLMVAAFVVLFANFYIVRSSWASFIISLLLASLYFLIGLVFIRNPMTGIKAFTLIFALAWIIAGISRLMAKYKFIRSEFRAYWSQAMLAMIDVVIGILLVFTWPDNSLFVISLILGVQFFILAIRFFRIHFLLSN